MKRSLRYGGYALAAVALLSLVWWGGAWLWGRVSPPPVDRAAIEREMGELRQRIESVSVELESVKGLVKAARREADARAREKAAEVRDFDADRVALELNRMLRE